MLFLESAIGDLYALINASNICILPTPFVANIAIVLRKYVNTVFDKTKNGVLSITDNNHLILKAFATAWRYREMYEECGASDKIIAMEHTSPRQFYRHLDLAYTNPETVNRILSGKQKVNVNELFQIVKMNVLHKAPTCYN